MASELGVQTIQHTNGTDALTIDSSGRVAIDQIQIPSFMVSAENTDQSYTATSETVVQFDTVDLDTESAWDATNHRYTPSIAGWYSFSACVRAGFDSTAQYVSIAFIKNGAAYATNDNWMTQFQASTADFENGSYPANPAIIYLDGSTDYVNLVYRTNQNCILHNDANFTSWFCGQLVKAGS